MRLRQFPFALTLGEAAPSCVPQLEGMDAVSEPVEDFALTPFYTSVPDCSGRPAGELLKFEAVPAPERACAWRVMVASRTWDDRPVAVTGLVVAPTARAVAPRPVLSWCHGTTGGNRQAAPSLAERPAQDWVQRGGDVPIDHGVPYLGDWLARGHVVVASDGYGLGGPGVHHYLVGSSGARNAIDLARAAGQLPGVQAGPNLLAFGWSVGGHTALFVGEEQPAYAPELCLRGVVAIAPADTVLPRTNIPHVFVMARAYADAYGVPLTGFTASGRALVELAGQRSIVGVFAESLKLDPPFFSGSDWNPAIQRALALNRSGQRSSAAPILLVHGSDDHVVPPQASEDLLRRAQAAGSSITASWHAGHTHRSVIAAGRQGILAWAGMRLM